MSPVIKKQKAKTKIKKHDKKKKKALSPPSYRFVFPELPQCGARSETARLVSQQVVSMATSSHVVMAAVEGRVVTVGRGWQERGFVGGQWLLIELIRSQLQRAEVSCHLVRHMLGKRTAFVWCVCVSTMSVCVCLWLDSCPIRAVNNSLLWWTIVCVCVSPGFTLHPHDLFICMKFNFLIYWNDSN